MKKNTVGNIMDIAIIGIAGIFPDAKNVHEYWQNIINKKDCIVDIPDDYWDKDYYYDPNPGGEEKTYSKRAGLIPEIDFDSFEFGMPPQNLESTSLEQLLSLVVAKEALIDAGIIGNKSTKEKRQKTGVILAATTGSTLKSLSNRLYAGDLKKILKNTDLPEEDIEKIYTNYKNIYPEWNEDSFPGFLGNVVSGRITNRFDLGATNCTVDAACASSFAAIKMAVSELASGECETVLTGGVNIDTSPFAFLCFSKTPALSKENLSRPFDEESDGMVIGDGIGMVVLKRLEDAKRDEDKIYAVIKGIGASSDGKSKSIYAPNARGQILALERAYANADIAPSSIGLIEAHGTGTRAGDVVELEALNKYFNSKKIPRNTIPIGSVKSQIGHTRMAAGVASLIKCVLALKHNTLPPSINVNKPNPELKLENSPFYIINEPKPWIKSPQVDKRRAAISSFGFGGTNYHVILEEYSDKKERNTAFLTSYMIFISEETREKLLEKCESIYNSLTLEKEDYFYKFIKSLPDQQIRHEDAKIGFVSSSYEETCEYIKNAVDNLKNSNDEEWQLPQGIYYRRNGIDLKGKVVALFSGQGSQYISMGNQLVRNFQTFQDVFSKLDGIMLENKLNSVSGVIYPKSYYNDFEKNEHIQRINNTKYSQPAIAAFSSGTYKILKDLGFNADYFAGHSFGELTALWAADVIDDQVYYTLAVERGKLMSNSNKIEGQKPSMLMIPKDENFTKELLKNNEKVFISNVNSQLQTVISGPESEINKIKEHLEKNEINTMLLPVSGAFHTKYFKKASDKYEKYLGRFEFGNINKKVFSNLTAKKFPKEKDIVKSMMARQMINPVLFKEIIENVHGDGGYLFVEFGPKKILSNLVGTILKNKPHKTISVNPHPDKDADIQLKQAVVQLKVLGLELGELKYRDDRGTIDSENLKNKLIIKLNGKDYLSDETTRKRNEALNSRIELDICRSLSQEQNIKVSNENEKESEEVSETFDYKISRSFKQFDKTADIQRVKSFKSGDTTNMNKKNNLDYLLQCQLMSTEVHKEYIKNQNKHLDIISTLSSQQKSIFENHENNHQVADVLKTINSTLKHIENSQESNMNIHRQYLNDQMNILDSAFVGSSRSIINTAENFKENYMPLSETGKTGRPLDYNKDKFALLNEDSDILDTEVTNIETTNSDLTSRSDSVKELDNEEEILNSNSNALVNLDDARIEFENDLLEIISEKTGYPKEMLDTKMDLESDLGIDSIKKVEVFSDFRERNQEFFKEIEFEELAILKTIDEIAAFCVGNEKKKIKKQTVNVTN